MLIIRIMQADAAAAGGRLDEALALLGDRRLRGHRRGQALADRLVAALVERGRAHLSAGRYAWAAADADRARGLGGDQLDVAELRAAASVAARDAADADGRAARAVAAAREHAAAGHASAAGRALAPFVDPAAVGGPRASAAETLMDDLAARRERLAAALRAGEAALAAGAVERAVAELARGRAAGLTDPRLDALADRAAGLLRERAGDAVRQGHLDAAERLVAALPGPDAEAERLRRSVGECRAAWAHLDAGRFREAEATLRRALGAWQAGGPADGSAAVVTATWADAALRHLRQAADAADALRAGPLGWFAAATTTAAATSPPFDAAPAPTRHVPPPLPAAAALDDPAGPPGDALPRTLLLRVDGVGSFLVLRRPRVTVGPIGASPAPDLPLVADPGAPTVAIERADDDYFLRPGTNAGGGGGGVSGVTVNGRPVPPAGRLLADGDRVALSPRCRFTFALPSPASTSAALDLTGARLAAADVRRVILMDRDLLLGPGRSAHVRADAAGGGSSGGPTAVLHVRGGRLYCAAGRDPAAVAVAVDGRPVDLRQGVPVGAHVRVNGLSFVVTGP